MSKFCPSEVLEEAALELYIRRFFFFCAIKIYRPSEIALQVDTSEREIELADLMILYLTGVKNSIPLR